VVLVGWFSGKGFSIVTKVFENINLAVSLVVLLIIIIFLFRLGTDLWLIKKQRR
jgi:hypothetical protein